MSNIISFQDNETILFRHKASHNNEQGELVITNIRMCFSFANSQIASVQLPWQSIDKTKYTPLNDPKGRVMVMIQTVQKGNPIIFQFVGELETCQRELDRLKEIISKVRSTSTNSNSVSQTSNHISSGTNTNTNSKEINNVTNTNTTSSTSIPASILESRKKLLDADKQLAYKYRDLVLGDKILTEEEFWSSHDSFHSSQNMTHSNHNFAFPDPTIRGKSTALFADVKKSFKNGKLTVNLNTETKESIFLLYPAVKYAYQEEVPLHKTEEEFWVSYFQSEYYNRDKGSTSETGNILINRSRIDEIIHQYEQKSKTKNLNTSSSTAGRNGHKKGFITSSVDSSVDLTSTYGDYRPSEVMSQLLSYEDRDVVADKDVSQGRHAVVEKYNKHSTVLMQSLPVVKTISPNTNDMQMDKNNIHINSNSVILEELIDSENDIKTSSKYLPLQLVNSGNLTTNHKSNVNTRPDENHEESQESAFGVSTFRKVAKTTSVLHLPRSIDIDAISGQNEIKNIEESIHLVWPSSSMAKTLNQNVIIPALRDAWQLQHEVGKHYQPQSNIYGTSNITDVSDTLSKHNNHSRDGISHVSDLSNNQQDYLFRSNQTAFLMEMREKFCTISELLRHFFAMLSTLSVGASTTRVEKLVQRLNQNKDDLKRKMEHVDATVTNRHEKLSCRCILEDMLKLLERAELKWKDYQTAILGNSGRN